MISSSIERMLIKAAQHSHSPSFKMSACIELNGEVISIGFNQFKTHPVFGVGNFGYIHAECDSIRKAIKTKKDLKKAKMYVYRTNRNLAKPCNHCQKIIKEYQIKEVYYSNKQWERMLT